MNERIRDFYLGDDAAWEEISPKLLAQMTVKLERKFTNLPPYRLRDSIADWLTEFYFQVAKARAEAEDAARQLNLTDAPPEINPEKLKLDFCAAETKFDLERETPFAAWAWRVLLHRAFDIHRGLSKERQLDELGADEQQMLEFESETAPDDEFETYLPFLRETITSVLEPEELIYFEIWMENGPDPTGKTVIAELENRTGEALSNAYVTKLKQRFLVKSYLALREARYQAEALSVLFRRFVQSDEMRRLFFPIMLEKIWRSFISDEKTVARLTRELPERRWRESLRAAETAINKTDVRADILKTADRHFSRNGYRPNFHRLIEIYADDRFGGGIRELFDRK